MQIEYKKKAVKYINLADDATKKHLKTTIEKLPLGDVKKLNGYENEYRLHVGDLRVLFSIIDGTITINTLCGRRRRRIHNDTSLQPQSEC